MGLGSCLPSSIRHYFKRQSFGETERELRFKPEGEVSKSNLINHRKHHYQCQLPQGKARNGNGCLYIWNGKKKSGGSRGRSRWGAPYSKPPSLRKATDKSKESEE